MLLNLKWVLWFSLQHLSEKILILRRNQRDIFLNVEVFIYSARCSWQILIKFEMMKFSFSLQNFEKCPRIKFNKNPCSGIRVISSGRTDRHDGANSLIFRNFTKASKNKKNRFASLKFPALKFLKVSVLIKWTNLAFLQLTLALSKPREMLRPLATLRLGVQLSSKRYSWWNDRYVKLRPVVDLIDVWGIKAVMQVITEPEGSVR